MHPLRKQRLKIVIMIVAAASVAAGLVVYALRDNINLFYTPSQIVAGEAPQGVRIRAGGMVVDGSIQRADDSLFTRFQVTDGDGVVTVHYTGILPDLFTENAAAVATGAVDAKGVFQASEVLAKHDENYTPPEVQDAMEKAHKKAQERAE